MKQLKKIIYIFLVASCVIFTSCDRTFEVKFNGETHKSYTFKCGRVDLTSISLGKIEFVINQKFFIDKEITLYKDSIEILYDGKTIPYSLEIENNIIEHSSIKKQSDFEIDLRFSLHKGLDYGEEITITPDGYLYCMDKKVDLGTIHLYLKEEE
jgi:hypothetical protein